MRIWRDIAAEVGKAVAVLALVFLSFAHQPIDIAVAEDGAWTFAEITYCGGEPDQDGGHSPCHACRFGIADLPQPPCVAEPVKRASARPLHMPGDDLRRDQAIAGLKNPRGPPALV